ncbi:MAG TPA: cyanophycinase [Ignavibacteria bacterium]|nr:cyanophycinase [Ignavibacteria bacterium]HRJ98152.1 cyanophycinase [Ignavibacteria bacterium]
MGNNFYKEDIGSEVLIIGGAEDKLNERHILRKFVEMSGGAEASILVIPIPSDFPIATAALYSGIFGKMGVKSVKILKATSSKDFITLDNAEELNGITGIFLTGGDQMRLTSIIGGTTFLAELKIKIKNGTVLAGSSAGAAGFSSTMIVRGEPTIQPLKDSIRLCPGLGILQNIIIDQHFTQRSRMNRLITAVSYNPSNLGIGIDENTAIHIRKDGILEVLGSGTVTIIDGSNVTYNTIAEVEESEPFSIVGLQINILNRGVRYDLNNRKPIEMFGDYLQI